MKRTFLANKAIEKLEMSTKSEQRLAVLNRHLVLSRARDDLEGRYDG